MKTVLYILLLLISAMGSFNVFAQATAPVEKILGQTIEVIKEMETKTDLLQAKRINVTFESEASTETGVGLKILIFKFKRSWQKVQTTTITYNFKLTPQKAFRPEPLKKALAKAIKEAYNQVSQIGDNETKLNGLTIKISFVIEKSTEIEGEYELSPITPSLGKSWKKKAIHTIEIEFDPN